MKNSNFNENDFHKMNRLSLFVGIHICIKSVERLLNSAKLLLNENPDHALGLYIFAIEEFGKGSYWWWKRTFDSFKKIVNFITFNHHVIEKIIEERSLIFKDGLSEENKTQLKNFFKMNLPPFYPTKYWSNTEYTKSFFNEQTIEYFVKKAYEKYLKYKKSECVSNAEFERIVLHGLDRKLVVKLMYYSPSLILYIINLEERYSYNFERKIPQTVSFILLMVLNDLLITRHRLYHGISSAQYGITEKKSSDSKSLEIELYLTCRLSNPIQETK